MLTVIINGPARSGKDTFIDLVGSYAKTARYSLADFPKTLLIEMGWKGSANEVKSSLDRKVLRMLCDACTLYGDIPLRLAIERSEEANRNGIEVFFVTVRRYSDIIRYRTKLNAKTLLVKSQRSALCSTEMAFVREFPSDFTYDFTIDNNSDLSALDVLAEYWVKFLPTL